jgi:hypothetical protein
MKNMKKLFLKTSLLSGLLLLFSIGTLDAQTTSNIQFVNTGAMNVDTLGIMYIQGDVQMLTTDANQVVQVYHNGTTYLEGSFFHDATGNVFDIVNAGNDWDKVRPRAITGSVGTLRFINVPETTTPARRYISTTLDVNAFDRVANYIAFPNVEISTRDTIYVPPTFGMDARTITRVGTVSNENNGVIVLASDVVGSMIFNASLRVTGDDGDFTVSPDAVIVEKRVNEYREATAGASAATSLMPFASPYYEMRSGYFAGNWVRRPLFDPQRNGFFHPYANSDVDGDGIIDLNQYITKARDSLITKRAYLIRLQPAGGTENDVYANLDVTAGEGTHDKAKFIFNGLPYQNLGQRTGRVLFTGEPVLTQRVSNSTTTDQSQNWLVGNSYTSGLNTQAIADYLMSDQVVTLYSTNMYIFHHGSTAYHIYNMIDDDIPPVQAMGVFMVLASRRGMQPAAAFSETLVIGPEYQIHVGGISSTPPPLVDGEYLPMTRNAQARSNSLNFVVTPADNPFVFSRSEIRFGSNTNISSFMHPTNRLFHLYGTNAANARLQRNALPFNTEMALLAISPAAEQMTVTLTAEDADNFVAQAVELYDRKTGQWHDLRLNNRYTFILSPGDNPNRFEVHFIPRNTTGLDNNPTISEWYAYNNQSELMVNGLNDLLVGKEMRIFRTAGVLHIQQTINGTEEQRINIFDLPTGVYLVSIQGRTVKFVK